MRHGEGLSKLASGRNKTSGLSRNPCESIEHYLGKREGGEIYDQLSYLVGCIEGCVVGRDKGCVDGHMVG